ncbi:ThiF family adenylyltransferase [Pseudonocardia sp. N23]|uniref:ThiF family adenylyltransferase n=1 Tax=Pseudonocardia sp. N23 TaxID=1987376 RepID=UPI000C030303|nr:ThiF family adenylyltransferase [Pseudonocardia sp. N23]GAY07078.1 molybdopterin biosynthesis protein MoeB [Pseudonocardia sp. N23]
MTTTGSRAALPAVLVVDPHRPLLERGPGTRVVGLSPGTAVVVDELTPPLAALLDELTRPARRDRVLARAVAAGADPAEAVAMVVDLLACGAVVDADEAMRTARRRVGAAVRVHGDGAIAVGVACGLAAAGVGTVEVVAGGVVERGDVGTGYLDEDRGRSRAAAAAAALRRVAPGIRTRLPARTVPDLVVLADVAASDPVTVRGLVAMGVAHLQARTRDGRGVVGPLVLPGRSACLECLDRHRADRDPEWGRLAPRLARLRAAADAPTVVATIGMATAQVLAVTDGTVDPPAALGATVEIDVAAAVTARRRWSRHSGCPCAGAGAQRAGDAAPQARRGAECTAGPRRGTIEA